MKQQHWTHSWLLYSLLARLLQKEECDSSFSSFEHTETLAHTHTYIVYLVAMTLLWQRKGIWPFTATGHELQTGNVSFVKPQFCTSSRPVTHISLIIFNCTVFVIKSCLTETDPACELNIQLITNAFMFLAPSWFK